MIKQALFAFLLMFALDFAWAAYIKWVAEDRIMKASLISAVLMTLTGGVTLSYVNNPTMLLPVALGAFCGTYACIWWRKRKNV